MSMTVNNAARPIAGASISHAGRPAGEKGPKVKINSCTPPGGDKLQLSGKRPAGNYAQLLQNGEGQGQFAKEGGPKSEPASGPVGLLISRRAAE